jgi:hypothetical protein
MEMILMFKETIECGDVNENKRVFDSTIKLKDNAMLVVRPELFEQWDFKKNDKLGLDVYNVTKGSNKRAWWDCPKCDSNYDMCVYQRNGIDKSNCTFCAGNRVNHTNCLANVNPQLASEWHPTLNGELTPSVVTCNSGKRIWWIGRCGHEWDTTISHRSLGKDCPYCCNKKVLKDSMTWTTNLTLLNRLPTTKMDISILNLAAKK